MRDLEFLFDGPEYAAATLVLSHGAGAPMDSPFLNAVAEGVARKGFRVVRFEFPYMRARREGGKRGAPDRESVLREGWHEAVSRLGGGGRLIVGGKSLGGRIASMIADEVGARGLVCLGYPFHPPGKPSRLRTKHLETLKTPALIVQGTRDPFGSREEVLGYRLSPSVQIVWIKEGDHSFKPRARSGRTEPENLGEAVSVVSEFAASLEGAGKPPSVRVNRNFPVETS